jgi:hypothetical protein
MDQLKPIPHPPPFQSAPWPHLELIRKLRLSRESWPAIADELAALGVRIDRSALRKFFKRAQKGKPPLGFMGVHIGGTSAGAVHFSTGAGSEA